MTSSQTKGELTLMFPWITQFVSMNSQPNTIRAISIESSARAAEVTEPMKGLSDRRIWASIWHDDEHARAIFGAYAARSVQPRHAFDRQVSAVLAYGDREDALATITVPTTVIHGTADTLIAPSGGERTAAVIPGADLVMVEGWGHDMAPGAWPQLINAIATHCHRADGGD